MVSKFSLRINYESLIDSASSGSNKVYFVQLLEGITLSGEAYNKITGA